MGEAADASNRHPAAPPSEDTDTSAGTLVWQNENWGADKQWNIFGRESVLPP